jgi:hypothetical protein
MLVKKLVQQQIQRNPNAYILMSTQTTGQNHYIKVPNKSLENEAQLFRYLGVTVTNQFAFTKKLRESGKWLLPCNSESSVFLSVI